MCVEPVDHEQVGVPTEVAAGFVFGVAAAIPVAVAVLDSSAAVAVAWDHMRPLDLMDIACLKENEVGDWTWALDQWHCLAEGMPL